MTKEEIQALRNAHVKAQEARRAIELEIEKTETDIKAAIGLGKADDVVTLVARRRELPQILIEKSAIESAYATAYYRAELGRTYDLIAVAEDDLAAKEIAFNKRKKEVEKEIIELGLGVATARQKLDAIKNEHATWMCRHNVAADGYLSALAGAATTL